MRKEGRVPLRTLRTVRNFDILPRLDFPTALATVTGAASPPVSGNEAYELRGITNTRTAEFVGDRRRLDCRTRKENLHINDMNEYFCPCHFASVPVSRYRLTAALRNAPLATGGSEQAA